MSPPRPILPVQRAPLLGATFSAMFYQPCGLWVRACEHEPRGVAVSMFQSFPRDARRA